MTKARKKNKTVPKISSADIVDETRTKEFRDAVHDYISVPASYCRTFVDTEIFQRLKSIEQTSMRPLYPSARHDRFVHSLGVYHLGAKAFHHLRKNTHETVLAGVSLDQYKHTFLIACLLHDCGHAPFSHTFESYYNREGRALQALTRLVDEEFINDLNNTPDPSPHELVSAVLLLEKYAQGIRTFGADPMLAARMIIGCEHKPGDTERKQIENCLIRLLHGKAIDVDKLDYIVRDTWASGVNNVSVDIHRLLSSLEIIQKSETRELAFRRSALSVVESVVDARNYMFEWIYSHHTVVYYQHLLQTAVKGLAKKLLGKKDHEFFNNVFSISAFKHSVTVCKIPFYLPTDGDLLSLLKQYRATIPEAQELLSRQSRSVPLWKTRAEFARIFDGVGPDKLSFVASVAEEELRKKASTPKDKGGFILLSVEPKLAVIRKDELFLFLLGQAVPFNTIYSRNQPDPVEESDKIKIVVGGDVANGIPKTVKKASFFYMFVPRSQSTHEDCEKFIKILKDLTR